jgi:hypothetical protein
LRNLAGSSLRARGVAASILEGLDEILTVNRLGLPAQLRRSLGCTNSIENMMGTVRSCAASAATAQPSRRPYQLHVLCR